MHVVGSQDSSLEGHEAGEEMTLTVGCSGAPT